MAKFFEFANAGLKLGLTRLWCWLKYFCECDKLKVEIIHKIC